MNFSHHDGDSDDGGKARARIWIKLVSLVAVWLLVVAGNSVVIQHFSQRKKKWSASDCLGRTLGVVGLVTGLLNITIYTMTMVTGRWLLGEAVCQLYGVLSTVLVSTWTWMLAIAALERLSKLLMPSEHPCLFSEVNTKIIVWGVSLLLTVVYLSPVYGWGEYSPFRGKLDLILQVKNYSSPSMARPTDQELFAFRSQLHGYLWSTMNSPGGAIAGITRHLTRSGQDSARQLKFTESGLEFPLRFSTREGLNWLVECYRQGALTEAVREMLVSNATLTALSVDQIDIELHVTKADIVLYDEVFMPMQESSTCGFDYSGVNEYTFSFVTFSWLGGLVLPLGVALYCYVRIFSAGIENVCFLSTDGRTPEDARMAKITACCSAVSFACDVPYFTASLVAGKGYPVPASVFFTSTILLFFRCSTYFLLCWMTGGLTPCCASLRCPSTRMCRRRRRADKGRFQLQEVEEGLLSAGNGCSRHDSPAPGAMPRRLVQKTYSSCNSETTAL